jgi:putative ABC transport system permease protein
MLQLKNITKNYTMGGLNIEALKDVSLDFRKCEFVAVLGPSGCGKTTLLNLVGGLDRYTSGDLVINGTSTTKYKDVDWDIYRNNSIGFVFQSYNLIPHQTALANVELAMTLAGISKSERRRRAIETLEKVGLHDQIYKKPGQMSGGQMQRVSIARALVNNPDILLADEPTGALDSETSIQVMDILKEIAKDRLVIMVTHNPDLAGRYSNRVIRLLDGRVTDDTNPYAIQEAGTPPKTKRKKISMSYFTAVSLSLNNLLTKKARTILTAFAGSIGIIGIALIMSLSGGMQGVIDDLEQDTLSSYPLRIQSQSMDLSFLFGGHEHERVDREGRDEDSVYALNIMYRSMQQFANMVSQNDLRSFKAHIDSEPRFAELANAITYGYDLTLQIFNADGSVQVSPSDFMNSIPYLNNDPGEEMGLNLGFDDGTTVFSQLIADDNGNVHTKWLDTQYEVLAGDWPKKHNEVILVVSERNEITDFHLYALGLMDASGMDYMLDDLLNPDVYDEDGEAEPERFTFDELMDLTFALVLNTDYYQKEGNIWADKRDDRNYMDALILDSLKLEVVGIVRPLEDSAASFISGVVGYAPSLTEYVIAEILASDIVKEQLQDPKTNVFTGFPFSGDDFIDNLLENIDEYIEMMTEQMLAEAADNPEAAEMLAGLEQMQAMMSEEDFHAFIIEHITENPDEFGIDGKDRYSSNIKKLGVLDIDEPSSINLFPKDFDCKEELVSLIADYNRAQEDAGNEGGVIQYTDFIALLTSGLSNLIKVASYVLIAFVSISLIVSSIMIAIITYISVLERTKEIGILRSIGAAKRDISRVFNAETMIEGLVAGVMGVGVTLLLNIPANAIIYRLTDISGLSKLPLPGAAGLILLSVFLTVLAGFIPSKMAAKKDPVVALRSE